MSLSTRPGEKHQQWETKTDPSNKAARSSYAVDMEADSASVLRDKSTLLQRVIDTFNAVLLHCQQETADNVQHSLS